MEDRKPRPAFSACPELAVTGLHRLSRGEHPWTSCQVIYDANVRKPRLLRKICGLGQTRLVQLEREAAARAQRHHGPREQTAKDIVAVGAAIQGKGRLEIGHFPGYLGKHRRRDIRRIGNHKVQTPKGSSGDACAQIALLDAHTIGKS